MRRLLWYLIAGTRGGLNRARILVLLRDRPYNAHQVSKALALDYKTVEHHMKVLEEHGLVDMERRGEYGALYFTTPRMAELYGLLEEIMVKVGKTEKPPDGESDDAQRDG